MVESRQTELQVMVRALTALQYEIQALSLGVKASGEVHVGMHQLQAEAKALMQSAQADADLLAVLERTQEVGVQIRLVEPPVDAESASD